MLKNRLLKFLPLLLALLLVFTVSVFAVMAEPEEESSEVSAETTTEETSAEETSAEETSSEETSETTSDETSAASSEATSSEASAESSATSENREEQKAPSNIPWKLIITVAVVLVIAAVLFILAKTNSKLGQKIAKFFKDYKSEIGKISWMPRKDLVRSTLVVLAVLIVASLAIGLLDYGFSALVRLLSSIG